MSRQVAVVFALILVVVSGGVHGVRAERWRQSAELETALARVDLIPMEFDDWQAETKESDAAAFRQAGALAYWTRLYTNNRKRQSVLAILMCGRSGRMAVHTPEICYRGAGYDVFDVPAATPIRSEAGGELGIFNTARFAKSTSLGSDLRLYWAWNDGGNWQAPRSPRWEFRGRPYLYKLYVSQELGLGIAPEEDAAADLLRVMLPKLTQALKAGAP